MTNDFDPADAGCWMAHGRPAHHAHALADAWRRFPDLPNNAPLDERMARGRERVQALRPLNEAIGLETERQRQSANFACVERQIAEGSTDGRKAFILHARDVHGYDWDAAYAYADGRYAAEAGWESRPPSPYHAGEQEVRRLAYQQGFLDGGGQPDDCSMPHGDHLRPLGPRSRTLNGRAPRGRFPANGQARLTSRHPRPGIGACCCSAPRNARQARLASSRCFTSGLAMRLRPSLWSAPTPGCIGYRVCRPHRLAMPPRSARCCARATIAIS